MKTKYSRKCTLKAIPQIFQLLISEFVLMARDKLLQSELSDMKGLINENEYSQADIDLLRYSKTPLVKLAVEAVDSLWELQDDFVQINSFDDTDVSSNANSEQLARDLVGSFLAIGEVEKETGELIRSYEDFMLFFETAPHVIYEAAILLMTGETSMGDPEYASVAWDKNQEIIFHLDRSDASVDLMATTIDMLLMWQVCYYGLDDVWE